MKNKLELTERMIDSDAIVSSIDEVIGIYGQSARFLGRFRNHCVVLKYDLDKRLPAFRVYIFTENYEYSIYINDHYCGCVSTCRKNRFMEDWHRGNDLPDGDNIEDTYNRIAIDIVFNEAEFIGEVVDARGKEMLNVEGEPCLGTIDIIKTKE